jgi:phosphoribosyl-dephospho-CoA transferase
MRPLDRLRRHDRVWLNVDWRKASRSALEPSDEAIIDEWIGRHRPLVIARHLSGDCDDSVRLGLALPGRRRLGFSIEGRAITRIAPPMPLEETIDAAPLAWRKPAVKLLSDFASLGLSLRVFGSLAWHCFAIAGSSDHDPGYLTATSDIDLLITPRTASDCRAACCALDEFEVDRPAPRLDGEFAFPDGSAVAWREFASCPDRILVKRMHEVVLLPFSSLEGLFARIAA